MFVLFSYLLLPRSKLLIFTRNLPLKLYILYNVTLKIEELIKFHSHPADLIENDFDTHYKPSGSALIYLMNVNIIHLPTLFAHNRYIL